MELQKYCICGEIRIPIRINSKAENKQEALSQMIKKYNRRSILVLDGDLTLKSGSIHPLLASEVSIEWFEALDKDDI